ncbi:MAG: ornithine decarboxylase SpeF [Rhodobacteraceae bacterium HLUCCA08]|nr:MAG: ornithine decarboxylase SpeF [Rhodobacteraceae bacterium HLUCCA08]
MSLHETAPRAGAGLSRIDTFIGFSDFDRPTLVIDTDLVAERFRALAAGLGRTAIHYAVKANPAPEILERLVAEGARFDAASRAEIAACLAAGARPRDISFGNTIKKPADIAWAWDRGVTLFAADAEAELDKIAEHAPGARVYIRLLVTDSQADWPLSRKFGCDHDTALALLDHARDLSLDPVGLSFHVGSQTRQAAMWDAPLAALSRTWHAARAAGHDLSVLNLGGGFPAFYGEEVQAPTDYAAQVITLVERHFGQVPHLMAEPGRGLVAEAGAIVAECLLVGRKSADDLHRWVYLDIGRFSGLAETEGEAIRYQLQTPRDGDATGPCVLAGPSCDSADVLYEKRPVHLPLSLQAGDRVVIRNAGAYTSSYSSVGFNGFPPLDVVVI